MGNNTITPRETTTGIAGTATNTTVTQRISSNTCNIHVTAAPANAIGTITYYYDIAKANICGPWLSRHFDFLDRHKNCSHTVPDYYQHYGDKYIRKFTDELGPRLSDRGKEWLIEARRLLQRYMEKGFDDNIEMTDIITPCKAYPDASAAIKVTSTESLELDSGKFRTFAFGTHPPAYIDAGLGDLPFWDLVEIGTTPDLKEWLKLDSWAQFWEIIKYLSHDKLNKLQEIPRSRIEQLKRAGIELRDEVIDRGINAMKNEIRRQLDRLFTFPRMPQLF